MDKVYLVQRTNGKTVVIVVRERRAHQYRDGLIIHTEQLPKSGIGRNWEQYTLLSKDSEIAMKARQCVVSHRPTKKELRQAEFQRVKAETHKQLVVMANAEKLREAQLMVGDFVQVPHLRSHVLAKIVSVGRTVQIIDILPSDKSRGFVKNMQTSSTFRNKFLLRRDAPRIALRSYSLSTGYQPNALGQDILSGVDVSVVDSAAVARPTTNVERERIQDLTTTTAEFAAGKEGTNLDELPSIPLAFIFQLSDELSPTRIGNAASQRAITNHVTDGQSLDGNQLVILNESSTEFVKPVRTNVRNLLVNLCNLDASLDTVLGAFLTTRQSLLGALQLFQRGDQRLRSLKALTIRSHSEVGETQVDSNLARSHRVEHQPAG